MLMLMTLNAECDKYFSVLPSSRPRDSGPEDQRRVGGQTLEAIMSVLTEPEPRFSSTESAKQLQSAFDVAPLRIRDVQARFNSRTLETGEDAMGLRGPSGISTTPEDLAAEVSNYMVRPPPLPTLLHLPLSAVFHAQVEVPVPRKQCQR